MSWRCAGYKKPPSIVYRAGELVWSSGRRLPLYGLGQCSSCGKVVALAPKAQTCVHHKS